VTNEVLSTGFQTELLIDVLHGMEIEVDAYVIVSYAMISVKQT